jgi:hypothetical protein
MKRFMEYVNDRLPRKKSGGWFDMTIDSIAIPDFSADLSEFRGQLRVPQAMIDGVNNVFDEHIQATAKQSYDHIMGMIASNFSSINDEISKFVNDVTSTYSFEDLNFFLDYDPPRYSNGTNISSLEDQRDNFARRSQVSLIYKENWDFFEIR